MTRKQAQRHFAALRAKPQRPTGRSRREYARHIGPILAEQQARRHEQRAREVAAAAAEQRRAAEEARRREAAEQRATRSSWSFSW